MGHDSDETMKTKNVEVELAPSDFIVAAQVGTERRISVFIKFLVASLP